MRIECEPAKGPTFRDLKVGEAFHWSDEDGSALMVKIDPQSSVNAVCLQNPGATCPYAANVPLNQRVIPTTCTVHFE